MYPSTQMERAMPLSAKQVHSLRLIADWQITGRIDENGFPCFSDGSTACTAAVMALSAKALVTLTITKDTASVALNERGRKILSKTSCHA
jgi:hypothetical protein